ncbi:MAG: hypothetical protein E5X74_09395 [Mesorhizobium sp.]|uniref:T1SS-143 repeat domain-containing protein n=1 Tax=Mesorhizobium sp. TaxID=1871066 RepID=UPI00122480F5|nr:hypothetical protein [Mesorhizobium sp.]TIO79210.1 MAG: hypothetical protein E5X75_01270 [Mesorhizobium sp.]TIO85825.1 MAG: hypothetical protein E5X74_09395 [Mesorhizobium sp.]
MALDITAQDIIIDESTGLQNDDIDPSDPLYSGNTTLQYLLTLGTSLEVAFKADFVQATADAGETITSVVLTQDSSGTPFSTTDGVVTDIQTVDGNYVWLFQDPNNADVVIGVIGTDNPTAEPDPATAPLAFSFGLDHTSTTDADLYLVQYVPLLNPDPTKPDDDLVDLTNKVFASIEGTSQINFSGQNAAPGNHDFYLINSPDDASKQLLVIGLNGGTANVSTQGFGINNQSINPGETLQVDFVTGGNLNAGSASQIQYTSHIETITEAGFTINQITPSQPDKRVDVTIKAFDNTANQQGTDFFDGTTTDPVDITSVKLTGASGFATTITIDGTYATASGNVTVTGLNGTGNAVTITGLDNVTTVDITTADNMDRLTVTGVDANEGCDITEFHFNTTTTNAHTEEVGSLINFDDDGPTATGETESATVQEDDLKVADGDSSNGIDEDATPNQDEATGSVAALVTSGADEPATFSLKADTSGLPTLTSNGDAVTYEVNAAGDLLTATADDGGANERIVFTLSLAANGDYTFDLQDQIDHPAGSGDAATLAIDLSSLLVATDADGDTVAPDANAFVINVENDVPAITVPFDGDQIAGNGNGTHETLANTVGASAEGNFGYDIGADGRLAAFYNATHSDFVDQDNVLAGIQLSLTGNLTGLVPNTETPFISSYATLQSEDATQATFNWQISYDSDPNTAGNQTATAGGTLVFDKDADTYTITLNDAVEGFTKDILHTSELLSKEPTSNVGHPNIVVEKLFEADSTPEPNDRDFFVQFTANSVTNTIKFGLNSTGDSDNATPTDTAWNPGDLVTNNHEDWVSATQSTNGVAGDTIQKGELLTLRFFDTSPHIATENITPSQTAADMAIKFDGIGTSEDLMVILQLVSGTDSSVHTSKAIYISNADIFKAGQVPTAYAADFPLDNNDGLVIIERNDYNGVGENWVIQGAQIMQSGNGITGPDSNPNLAGLQETPTAIDLNRATGSTGGSSQTALVNWDAIDNDVLKIVDLGFTSTQTTTPDAHLDFGVQVADADGDTTTVQHILVDIA